MDETEFSAPSQAARHGHLRPWLLVLLIALLALLLWLLWRTRQDAQLALADAQTQTQRIHALQDALGALQQERGSLSQRIDDGNAVNRALREEVLGLRERTRTLEDALAALSESRQGGTQALRLDEAEFMLRMAEERYRLFHDAAGALDATRLAGRALTGVDAPVYAPLRDDVAALATALAQLRPAARTQQLQTLAALRAAVWSLALRKPTAVPVGKGLWARIGGALGSLVRIEPVAHAPLSGAGAVLLHELLALDLAQAQGALLAWDAPLWSQSLQQARTLLAARFDTDDTAGRAFAAELEKLQPLPVTPLPQLGAVLEELRRLRALNAVQAGAAPAREPRR